MASDDSKKIADPGADGSGGTARTQVETPGAPPAGAARPVDTLAGDPAGPRPVPAKVSTVVTGPRPPATPSPASAPAPAGAPPLAGTRPAIPERLGPYKVLRLLGEGGMGQVYLGHDDALDRPVGIKVLAKELAADPAFTERFLREARAIAKVSHPNVVPIYYAGQEQGICFFAMEFVKGSTLETMIRTKGPLDAKVAVSVITQAAQGLEAAHARSILHRDVKPSNIIIDDAGQVKLLDFGIAKDMQSSTSQTSTGAFLGTPRYMSPEVGRGRKPDFRSDIYSLGVTLFEALTGAPPFDADTPLGVIDKHVHEPLPNILTLRKDIPLLLVRLLERLLAKDPAARHESYAALLKDLATAARAVDTSPARTLLDRGATTPAPRMPMRNPVTGGSGKPGGASCAATMTSTPAAGVHSREEAPMVVREGCVSGQFYPAGPDECSTLLDECVAATRTKKEADAEGPVRAAIVPHAGWVYSGVTAAHVFALIHDVQKPITFILLGAVHVQGVRRASLYPDGFWRTPLGDVKVDSQLSLKLQTGMGKELAVAPEAHAREHSLEVQVPFIKRLFPQAMILPIMVPPDDRATGVGERIASITADVRRRIVVIGSSDLTHYGHSYGFLPQGEGPRALDWVKKVNDKRVIDLALKLKADDIVPEVDLHQNACGAGAIAATVAYAKSAGAIEGRLLHYTTSHDVMPRGEPDTFVGYAGIIF